jgi:hypothetical protein
MRPKCESCGGEVRPRNGKVTKPCRKCRQAPRKAAAAAKEKRSPAPAKVTRIARLEGQRGDRTANGDLEAMKVPDLQLERERCLARAAAVTAELKRRRDELDDALGEDGSTRSTGTGG